MLDFDELGIELDFEALGVELDDDAKKKIIDAATSAQNNNIAGLKAKNGELIGAQRKLKEQLKQFDGLDVERYKKFEAVLNENEEAKLIADGKIDELINKRLSREQATWQSQLEQKDIEAQKLQKQIEALQGATIASGIASAAAKAGLAPTAIEDAQLIAKHSGWVVEDGQPVLRKGEEIVRGANGVITFEEWLEQQRETRPHWFPNPKGAGSQGNKGGGHLSDNPWKKESFNLSQQGRLIKENPALAAQMKAEAGVK